ncbi:MAG: enoyl-CoA hydratase/isomerase family protein [Myxococcota bacterium]|nr:enoyl-CoA hydratase/isomerase family protein [Myxococcota bacterium]
MIDLQQKDAVFVLTMQSGENRFNRSFITALNEALDSVEASDGPAALVTVGQGKFYSNGLDLEWLPAQPQEVIDSFLGDFERLFARLLSLPMISVAALNGHAFAGGAMFSLAHDFRVMRTGRGYWCLPEIDLGMPLRPGMNALITGRLAKNTAHEAIVTGRRYAAEEALAAGIVQQAVPEEDVLDAAVARAAPHVGKSREAMQALKREMYRGVLETLEAGAPHRA